MIGSELLFAAVRDGEWVWGLNDPDTPSLLVTALYFICAILCGLSAKRSTIASIQRNGRYSYSRSTLRRFSLQGFADGLSSERAKGLHSRFWLMLSIAMTVLGINKQGDIQTLIAIVARKWIREAGLYDQRRTFQLAFIIGVAAVALVGCIAVCWVVARWPWTFKLATCGLLFQVAFIVIRAASFHHIDIILSVKQYNLTIESIGLILVMIAAFMFLRGTMK
jgi:hypothetical protein